MPTPVVIPRLDPLHTALLVIDMQVKLLPSIEGKSVVVRRAARAAQGFAALELPILVSEHQPRGLGGTTPEVKKHLESVAAYEEKTRFSACAGRVERYLVDHAVRCVVLCGIETHTSVQATALDLLERGYTVALCLDATGSRRTLDHDAALARLMQAGVLHATVESVLIELCADAASDRFRALKEVLRSTE